MTEEERLDIVEATDEEGNSLFLRVERYFYYNGDEYVLLRKEEADRPDPLPEEEALYVMRVEISKDEEGDEVEDFLPVEESLMEALVKLIGTDFREDEELPHKGSGH